MLNYTYAKNINKHKGLQPSRHLKPPFVANPLPLCAVITTNSNSSLQSRRVNQHRKRRPMEFLDPFEYPIGASNLARLCNVNITTAQRWLSGKSRPPAATARFIQLTQRERIMPDSWPHNWKINRAGALDIGHAKIALTPTQLEWYFTSVQYWSELIRLLPAIEARIEELQRMHPGADIVDLSEYRTRLKELKARPFLLPSWG